MEILFRLGRRYPNIAYLYAVIGYVSQSLLHMIVKSLSKSMTSFQIIFFKTLLLLAFNTVLLYKQNVSCYIRSPHAFKLIMVRILYMALGSVTMYFCIQYLPVSTVATLYNTGPIFIFFIEKIQYNKPLNKTSLTLTLLSFIGVVFIFRPAFLFGRNLQQTHEYFQFFVFLMLLAAFGTAMNKMYIYLLSKNVSPVVNMQYSHLGFLIMGAILCNFKSIHIQLKQISLNLIILLVVAAILSILYQYLIFAANTLKKPSLTMPFGYVCIVTSYLADLFIFGSKFQLVPMLGIFLTSAGLIGDFLLNRSIAQKEKLKLQAQWAKTWGTKSIKYPAKTKAD